MTTDPRTPRPPDDPAPGPPPDPPAPSDLPAPPDLPALPDLPAPADSPAPPDLLTPDDRADLDRLDGLRGPTDLAELVGAEAALGAVVRVSGTGDLVASLPVLIGFHPRDSLLLVSFGGANGRRVGLTVRVDLPRPDDVGHVCADAVGALATDNPSGAAVVVVQAGVAGSPGPYRSDVAAAVQTMLVEAGIEPQVLVWAAGTGHGDRWACFDLPGQRCGCTGVLPDPAATSAAAAAVRRGSVVLPDRAALADVLAADGETALRRRAGLRAAELDRAGTRAAAGGDPGPDRTAEHLALLAHCIDEAARCRLVVDDRTVLGFCAAFDVPAVRDAAVRLCLGPDAPHAEQLWAALSRSMPAPECAEPAALFAVCALLRGDGALAAIAVERALEAFGAHRLARIVDLMLRQVTGPGPLRRLLEQAYGAPPR
ncbi:uncharacterized protein DUF4192 [Pseudonocardia sediminis]|uniref:Uncharacterized protein DUF4192 n=1 Tax=Pseudonocardia sediminis TaxID=1397368 RepID=A0A4Q7V377_PSEST|nr:DUF4192 domain-containing protein [Pseudonocardia sediminis]RZT87039.1 uncharacterized protein DUF4192 [Pseudonocardia sediminis]